MATNHYIITPNDAEAAGLDVPSWAPRSDFILIYDKEGDLIAWGPESERAHHEKVIARFS